jgi:hypothetical protein
MVVVVGSSSGVEGEVVLPVVGSRALVGAVAVFPAGCSTGAQAGAALLADESLSLSLSIL